MVDVWDVAWLAMAVAVGYWYLNKRCDALKCLC